MGRGRKIDTLEDIHRHLAAGVGAGQGAAYKPWLRVRDVPSQGRSRMLASPLSGRVQHLLSDYEWRYWLAVHQANCASGRVVDVREQFPLLPVEETEAIAEILGVRPPRLRGSRDPMVLTTDFLIALAEDGQVRQLARSIKPPDRFQPTKACQRTIEKLEIERIYWARRNIDWAVVTETPRDRLRGENLEFLYLGRGLPFGQQGEATLARFVMLFDRLAEPEAPLLDTIDAVAHELGIPRSAAVATFKEAAWRGEIPIDLTSSPLSLQSPWAFVTAPEA